MGVGLQTWFARQSWRLVGLSRNGSRKVKLESIAGNSGREFLG